ncbi:hypothetical protein NF212_24890 [Parasalinivibrio latis]|uniref:hypothetical protein n=1 Tax=Parasalinivibrio latis TaxID=2952610 RepID=UPI0030E3EABE
MHTTREEGYRSPVDLQQLRSNGVIWGNVEALGQMQAVIEAIDDTTYSRIAKPYVQSSIGSHVRHINDLYLSLVNGVGNNVIDYDQRRRGHEIEMNRRVALNEIKQLSEWMTRLDFPHSEVDEVNVITETTLESNTVSTVLSNWAREWIFVATHAVHHLAIIRIAAGLQGITLPTKVGIAAATASFIRGDR